MPSTSIHDCAIHYEIFGAGVPVVITGGGREGCDDSRALAEKLAAKYRVILWDRATIGRSDIQFEGPRDLELWANQLHELLKRLDAAPAYLAAPSNGARVSMVTALRYPEVVRGLFLYLITGSTERGARNLSTVFVETAEAAATGDMRSVTEVEFWADRIRENPANRGRLLAMRPEDVEATMRRWAGAFYTKHTIMGFSDDDLARITAPACVIDATEPTDVMRRYNKELADLLPNAELLADELFQEEWSGLVREHGLGGGHYTSAPRLAALIERFVDRQEASATT